jgi:MYXO-CTERM domain-containing protein
MHRLTLLTTLTLSLAPLALAEGTSELGPYQALRANTILHADIFAAGVEAIVWAGTGDVRLTAPDGSDMGVYPSGSTVTSLAGQPGAYVIEVLSSQNFTTAWDVSVANAILPGGRIWSTNWRFNAGSFAASRSTFASFYAVVPAGSGGETSVIELQVDGLSGYVYDLNANGEGVQGEQGGRSVSAAGNSTLPDYPIYLYPPTNASYTRSAPAAEGFWLNGGGQQNVLSGELTECNDIWSGHSGLAFYFETDVEGTYHILCDLDGDGFERTSGDDVFLVGSTESGWNTVPWSGYAPDGSVISEGDYECQLSINVGEFHYVGYDIETAYQGLRLYEVDGLGQRAPLPMYWDDSAIQSNAQTMLSGAVGRVSSGESGVVPGAYGSTAVANVDARSWGAFNSGGKGNEAYLDTYTWLGSTTGATMTFHSADGLVDSDSDGVSDYEERCWCGTDPNNTNSLGGGGSDADVCSPGVSSGGEGGLESNGRLQSALAHRAMRGTRGVRRQLGLVSESMWQSLVPDTGPLGSVPVETSPTGLALYTNADEVRAWDYMDADGRRVGAVMVIETTGALYEHTKAICDRAGGAALTSVGAASIGGGEVVRSSFLTEDTQRDHSTTVMLFEQPDEAWEDGVRTGGWTAASGWLLSDYPVPDAGQTVVEVQIWAASPGFAEALTTDVLERFERTGPVQWTRGGGAPQAYVTEASTLGGLVTLDLGNPFGSDVSVTATVTLEDGTQETVALAAGRHDTRFSLESELPLFSDAMVDVRVDGEVVDKVWLSDGVWVPFHDGLFGGRTQHTAFSNTTCAPSAGALNDAADTLGFEADSATPLSGCGQVEAVVSEYAGVARHLAGKPVDVLASGSLVFWAESNAPVTVCVESSVTHTFACSPETDANGWTAIPVSELIWDGAGRMDPRHAVSFVSFTTSEEANVQMTVASLALVPWVPETLYELSDDQLTESFGCAVTSSSGGWLWLLGLAALAGRRRH